MEKKRKLISNRISILKRTGFVTTIETPQTLKGNVKKLHVKLALPALLCS
jgi:hypothetical protein